MHWTRETLAWAAGIIEGEGTIVRLVTKAGHLRWTIEVQMTDEDVIRRLHTLIGLGKLYGPYHRGNRPIWRWIVTKQNETYALVAAIYHQLGTRRRSKAKQLLQELPPITSRRT